MRHQEVDSIQARLKCDILSALNRVYAEDGELLLYGIDVCERSLMHRFTHYFMELVESSKDNFYNGLRVDGEYNRHGVNPKRLAGNLIFPDVIVHKRGVDERNLCVIEFKKSFAANGKRRSQRTIRGDIARLRDMTIPLEYGGEFGYQWGLHVIFCHDGVEMMWFYNGEGLGEYVKYYLPQACCNREQTSNADCT